MTIDKRLEALAGHVELMAGMQLQTERELKRLTREVRLFRHFVLSMGANLESRLLKLEGLDESDQDGAADGEKS